MTSIPDAQTRKRRARAAWAYSFKPATALGVDGVPYGTLKGLISETGPAPSLEQAIAIAEAAGLPATFILTGDMNPPAVDLRDELANLASTVADLASGEAEAALRAAREAAERLRGGSVPDASEADRPRGSAGDENQ